jgi:hypothetical protein
MRRLYLGCHAQQTANFEAFNRGFTQDGSAAPHYSRPSMVQSDRNPHHSKPRRRVAECLCQKAARLPGRRPIGRIAFRSRREHPK